MIPKRVRPTANINSNSNCDLSPPPPLQSSATLPASTLVAERVCTLGNTLQINTDPRPPFMGKRHHTRTAEKLVKWTARRLEVEYERTTRTCSCPPHLPHVETCEFSTSSTPKPSSSASSSAASSATAPALTTNRKFDFKKAAEYFAQKVTEEQKTCSHRVSLSDSDEEQEEKTDQKEPEEDLSSALSSAPWRTNASHISMERSHTITARERLSPRETARPGGHRSWRTTPTTRTHLKSGARMRDGGWPAPKRPRKDKDHSLR